MRYGGAPGPNVVGRLGKGGDLAEESHDADMFAQSPTRQLLQAHAFNAISKQADRMKTQAAARNQSFKQGDVVHIPVHKKIGTKDVGKTLTAVICDIKTNGYFILACKDGVLKNAYDPCRVRVVQGAGNNPSLCGLDTALLTWRIMPQIDETTAVRATRLGGVHNNVRCNCTKGDCLSDKVRLKDVLCSYFLNNTTTLFLLFMQKKRFYLYTALPLRTQLPMSEP